MDFTFFTPSEVKDDAALLSYIFETYVENMYYLFGEDLKDEKSQQAWIRSNLENPDKEFYWRLILAHNGGENAGFLIYTIQSNVFYVNDIQIGKKFRYCPAVLKGLFCNAFTKEKDEFEQIAGYINDKNIASKNNFLRCADKTEKTERGIRLYISKDSLFKRFRIR